MIKKTVATCFVILFVFSVFLTSCSGYTRVESAGFDKQLNRWCPEIRDYSLKQRGDTLFVKLVANEDLDAGTVNQSMTWISCSLPNTPTCSPDREGLQVRCCGCSLQHC